MTVLFKPMLATEAVLPQLKFPLFASPKLDGLRCTMHRGVPHTRSMKLFPNAHVNKVLNDIALSGLDGELIVGDPTAQDCIQQCTSHLMSHDKVFQFDFHVFDLHDRPEMPFQTRYALLESRLRELTSQQMRIWLQHDCRIELVPQERIDDLDQLHVHEEKIVNLGYEGLILRSVDGLYKQGRSTVKEGLLLKVKRFVDGEAIIIGFEEQMFNGNEAMVNELGRTKRSTAKAGLVGKGTLGALLLRDLKTNVEFSCGTGIDDKERAHIWANREKYTGAIWKYKSFPIGVKDKPRHPVSLGRRDVRDM